MELVCELVCEEYAKRYKAGIRKEFSIMKLKPYSATALTLGAFFLMTMGVYFVFLRPPLLPEDFKYIATTSSIVQDDRIVRSIQSYFNRI